MLRELKGRLSFSAVAVFGGQVLLIWLTERILDAAIDHDATRNALIVIAWFVILVLGFGVLAIAAWRTPASERWVPPPPHEERGHVPSVPPVPVDTRQEEAIRDELRILFRARAHPAYIGVQLVLGRLTRQLFDSYETPRQELFALLWDGLLTRATSARSTAENLFINRFDEELTSNELQEHCARFYRWYWWLSAWTLIVGHFVLGTELENDVEYRAWLTRDGEFRNELGTMTMRTAYRELDRLVNTDPYSRPFRDRVPLVVW